MKRIIGIVVSAALLLVLYAVVDFGALLGDDADEDFRVKAVAW